MFRDRVNADLNSEYDMANLAISNDENRPETEYINASEPFISYPLFKK